MRRVVAILALLVPLLTAGSASACACCAEPGTWYQARTPVGATERALVGKLRFTIARAIPGPEEAIPPSPVKATMAGRTWRWQLGTRATLTFQLPTAALTFAADIHDGRMGGGGGPLLYKELRLAGRLTATGALHGTHYMLVLQGRGNNCPNAADFHSWHLDIGGPRGVALYGTFR